MGWSCSQAAGNVEKKWSEFCRQMTGSSNVFPYYGKGSHEAFYEIDRFEYRDGRITGNIFAMSSGHVIEEFQINGDGTIAKAPKVLWDAAEAE